MQLKWNSPQQIETAHRLLEGKAHFARNQFLRIAQYHRIAYLFALAVSFHFAIEGWALARLRVRVVRSNGVHFHIGAIGRHEILINERARFADT